MRKASIALVSALAGATALYSGLWFYQAQEIKKQAHLILEQWVAQAKQENITISYGDLSVGGFPFQRRVKLKDPIISNSENGEGVQLQAEEFLVSKPVFGDNRVTLSLKGDLTLTTGEGTTAHTYTVHFPTAPTLRLAMPTEGFQGLEYEDNGYVLKQSDGTVLAEWKRTEINVDTKRENGILTVDAKATSSGSYSSTAPTNDPLLDKVFALNRKFGDVSFTLDAGYTGPENSDNIVTSAAKLDIRTLSMDSALFDVSVKGNVDKQADSMIPVAAIELALQPVTAFNEFWTTYLGTVGETLAAQGESPEESKAITQAFTITEQQKAAFIRFLTGIADSGTLANDSFITTIRSDNGGNVTIGQKTLEQAMELATRAFASQQAPVGEAPAAPAPESTAEGLPQNAPAAGEVPSPAPAP